MSFAGLLNRSCVIKTPVYGAVDDYGQPAVTYTFLTTVCRIEPNRAKEGRVENPKVIAEFIVFLPAGTQITEKSVLTIAGIGYNILEVQPFDGFSVQHHIELGVERIH